MSSYAHKSHNITVLLYHLVFPAKYRRAVIDAAVDQVLVKKTFDLGFASICNGADPDNGVRRVYVSSNIGPVPFSNCAGYRNWRIDKLLDLGSEPVDREARRRHYVEIQRILADDVPYFWLIDSEGFRAHRTAFSGFRLWTGAFVEAVTPTTLPPP